jgi:6-pyruvoyltetrahydropterin/6-carboxytetrahydropterin synthase
LFRIGIKKHFSSAHYLRGYKGKCEDLHGHNWQVEVTVAGADLDELGMVMDFKLLKQHLSAVLEELDHRLLNEHPHFAEHNPSSEELARYICQKLTEHMKPGITVEHVTVWESEHCWARYSP